MMKPESSFECLILTFEIFNSQLKTHNSKLNASPSISVFRLEGLWSISTIYVIIRNFTKLMIQRLVFVVSWDTRRN
jgi:uncharacterized membrane protein YpjA